MTNVTTLVSLLKCKDSDRKKGLTQGNISLWHIADRGAVPDLLCQTKKDKEVAVIDCHLDQNLANGLVFQRAFLGLITAKPLEQNRSGQVLNDLL